MIVCMLVHSGSQAKPLVLEPCAYQIREERPNFHSRESATKKPEKYK